jgi:glycosyltransferase involved in cell wall biosynthesis
MHKATKKKTISIVIPFFNEEENLKVLVPSIIKSIKKTKNKIELFLVDDLSTDNGYKFCKNFSSKKIKINVLKLKKKGKQAGATREAFKKVKTDYVILMDADLQDNPKYIPQFIDKINKNYDVIIGDRQYRKINLMLKISILIYNYILEKIFKKKLKTYKGSFHAYNFRYLKNVELGNNHHRYLTPIAIARGAKKCILIKVKLNDRLFGKSNYSPRLKIFGAFLETSMVLMKIKLGYYKY